MVDHHVDLGDAPGRANAGDKLLTMAASASAGGPPMADIDNADALWVGGTEPVLRRVVKAPSSLGTVLRSFRWDHVRQLDRLSREALARAWAAGAGLGDDPLPSAWTPSAAGGRDLRVSPARRAAPQLRRPTRLSPAPRHLRRQGRALTARGAARFLRETISRVRYAGATGPLTVRAYIGFYTHPIVAACRDKAGVNWTARAVDVQRKGPD